MGVSMEIKEKNLISVLIRGALIEAEGRLPFCATVDWLTKRKKARAVMLGTSYSARLTARV